MWFGDENFTRERVLTALTDEFDRRQNRNAGYSIRAYARDLDVDYSVLSRVLRKERRVSWDLAQAVKNKIKI